MNIVILDRNPKIKLKFWYYKFCKNPKCDKGFSTRWSKQEYCCAKCKREIALINQKRWYHANKRN